MDHSSFRNKRKSDNRKLALILADVCVMYDLRMNQLITMLNKDGDYFNEEPEDTIKRLIAFVKSNFNQKD